MENLLETFSIASIAFFFISLVIFYPLIGIILLFKFFRKGIKKYLRLGLFLIFIGLSFLPGLFFEKYRILTVIILLFIAGILSLPVGVGFLKNYKKTREKKYLFFSAGHFLLFLVFWLWTLLTLL